MGTWGKGRPSGRRRRARAALLATIVSAGAIGATVAGPPAGSGHAARPSSGPELPDPVGAHASPSPDAPGSGTTDVPGFGVTWG